MLHGSAIFLFKMGPVSDSTLLQVPVGHTRHVRVISLFIIGFHIRLNGPAT